MRSLPARRFAGIGVLALAIAGTGGCAGYDGDERDARAAVDRLLAAVGARDGAVACGLLATATRAKLEASAGQACRRAILDEDLEPATAANAQVFVTSAETELTDGTVAFLDRTPSGWRVAAVGCTPRGDLPADCPVED